MSQRFGYPPGVVPTVFRARVGKVGINPFVAVPAPVLKVLRAASRTRSGPIPVAVALNGPRFRATIVNYRAKWRLYLNLEMQRAARIDVGDVAEVAVTFDAAPRSLPVPSALARALKRHRAAATTWDALVPSRRKEILAYLNSLKTESSVQRNVVKVVAMLTGGASRPRRR